MKTIKESHRPGSGGAKYKTVDATVVIYDLILNGQHIAHNSGTVVTRSEYG